MAHGQDKALLPDGTEIGVGDMVAREVEGWVETGEVKEITPVPGGRYRLVVLSRGFRTTWSSAQVTLTRRYLDMTDPLRRHRFLLYLLPPLGLGGAVGFAYAVRDVVPLFGILVMNLVAAGMVTGHIPRFFYRWPHNRTNLWVYFVWVYGLLLWDAGALLAGIGALFNRLPL